jgi:hypothetical protein
MDEDGLGVILLAEEDFQLGASGDVDGIFGNLGVFQFTEGYDWNRVVHCGNSIDQFYRKSSLVYTTVNQKLF